MGVVGRQVFEDESEVLPEGVVAHLDCVEGARRGLGADVVYPAESGDERQQEEALSANISLENVSFSYNKQSSSMDLENISLEIAPGSVFGIIGGTGSGKSTLLKLLNHTYDVTEGKITIAGCNVNDMTDSQLADIFGIVPQKAALFSGTVKSNLSMKVESPSEGELIEALTAAQAIDFINEKEGKLEAEVAASGRNFSGGQRQRLTIARGLMGHPKVVVLDDSSSALDLATEARLRKALRELSWKPTLIIVSQRASSVKDADQILVLDDGKCVGLGRHEDLIKTCPTYEEIYYCQYPREEAAYE